jgi:hypothetical protein
MTADLAGRIRNHYFEPSRKVLLPALELLRSYQLFLQTDALVAHLFGVPLASDLQANSLGHFFSRPQPQVLEEAATAASPVQWADIVRIPTYAPVRQEDGSYHLRLPGSKKLVKLSEFDHDMMTTAIPSQMINPKSYPGDVSAEIEVTRLARDQVARLKDLVSECLSHPAGLCLDMWIDRSIF